MQGRILVVHRNELILDVIQEMLQDIGYAVTLATDGHRALGKAMSGHFNLIIVNHTLTGNLDGAQLVERMRKYGVRVPIVGTAPDATWASLPGSSATEVDYLLPSPFDYSELIDAVETLLNRRRFPSGPLDIDSALPDSVEPLDALSLLSDPSDALQPPPPAPPEPLPESPRASLPEPPVPDVKIVRRSSGYTPEAPDVRRVGPSRVLLVDPNEALCKQVADSLAREGYEVTPMTRGQEAYEATMLNDYELILTDLWLVGMDGFEMIEAMRKSGVTAPIAIHTAHITRDMVHELLEWRICKIFLKPAKTDDLLSLVRQTVDG